jgi:anti-sigma factor RsiW
MMGELNACESMASLIARYADGTLAVADRARVEAHVVGCSGCRAAIAEQSDAIRLLAELPMSEASPGFAADVLERVAQRAGLLDLLNWRAWTLRLAPVAALLLWLAWAPGSRQSGTTAAGTASAQIEAWAAGGSDSTTALLVSTETDGADLLAAAYEDYAR